ncbi:hypothetical protein A1A1_12272 [Planococcus antarcticus DSM 14505]|uniref:Uncharacterized protein n=1 Tax=Planococcus antarcticus DSM 14505 TaxID=1185653 RepID=A0AA87LRG8_9BACL|nr:hypothetical protein [Planococcus antarcticus]EIM06206.1 hypothetical protein A1A1_12272 [Planococcus antarcticus DSM 14505]
MECKNCSVEAIRFEIKLEGVKNLSASQIVIDHLERREIGVIQKKNKLQMDEKGAVLTLFWGTYLFPQSKIPAVISK